MTRPDDRRTLPPRPRKGRLFRVIPVVAVVCVGAVLAAFLVPAGRAQELAAPDAAAGAAGRVHS